MLRTATADDISTLARVHYADPAYPHPLEAQGRYAMASLRSMAAVTPAGAHVRIPPISRPSRAKPALRKRAIAGRRELYSITSSARASRVGGMARPSAFAVLRLITSS